MELFEKPGLFLTSTRHCLSYSSPLAHKPTSDPGRQLSGSGAGAGASQDPELLSRQGQRREAEAEVQH